MSVPMGGGSSSEQVWTDLQSWPPGVTSRAWGPVRGAKVLYRTEVVALYSAVHCIVVYSHKGALPPRIEWQTDTCENITFPQLRWRVIISIKNALSTSVYCSRVKVHLWQISGYDSQFANVCLIGVYFFVSSHIYVEFPWNKTLFVTWTRADIESHDLQLTPRHILTLTLVNLITRQTL